MSDPYNPFTRMQVSALGARVLVMATCGCLRDDAQGIITSNAEVIQTIQGEDFLYWVKSDVPLHDLSGGGPYEKAKVLSRCLTVPSNPSFKRTPDGAA